MTISVKRIYEPAETDDGYRVLVDGMWPRGIKKAEARIDAWHKDIAPSKELRQWFGHEPAKWEEFQEAYRQELKNNPSFEEFKNEIRNHATVTFLTATKNVAYSHVNVLRNSLQQ